MPLATILKHLAERPALTDELRRIAGRLAVTLEELVAADEARAVVVVATTYQIPVTTLLSQERRQTVRDGREQVWTYCFGACRLSLGEIARVFGRTREEIRTAVRGAGR